MTAEIIQFIPRANPERPTLLDDAEAKAAAFLDRAPALTVGIDTAPSEMNMDEGA